MRCTTCVNYLRIAFFGILFTLPLSANENIPLTEHNFDHSIGKGSDEFTSLNAEDINRYLTLKKIYKANKFSKVSSDNEYKIPKIIHQVWLGTKSVPSSLALFQEKWKALHPEWEYRLWTDNDLKALDLDLKDLMQQTQSFAEKSDMLRCELLDRFGGVYADVDVDPCYVLDLLHKKYDFYAGIDNLHKVATSENKIWLGISIIAARPHHPIIKRWKELIRHRWDEVNETYSKPIERVINHTYFPFTMAFFEKYREGNYTNIALPPSYFYAHTKHYCN